MLRPCWRGPGIGPGLIAAEPAGGDLESLFESDDPRLIRMATDVMRHCVLAKIKPPEGTAKRRWLQAGTGDAFYGQWIWDTMFVVDLLAILPEHKETIRDVFQNYWDFQERWNARFPDYAHDMVPCMIEPRGNTRPWWEYPAYSQIPILGWGIERVYQRNGDKELLRQCSGAAGEVPRVVLAGAGRDRLRSDRCRRLQQQCPGSPLRDLR